jgi:hypothetical protein
MRSSPHIRSSATPGERPRVRKAGRGVVPGPQRLKHAPGLRPHVRVRGDIAGSGPIVTFGMRCLRAGEADDLRRGFSVTTSRRPRWVEGCEKHRVIGVAGSGASERRRCGSRTLAGRAAQRPRKKSREAGGLTQADAGGNCVWQRRAAVRAAGRASLAAAPATTIVVERLGFVASIQRQEDQPPADRHRC